MTKTQCEKLTETGRNFGRIIGYPMESKERSMMQSGSGATREWKRVRILFIFRQYTFLFICCIFLSLCVNQLVPFHGIKFATEELQGYLHLTSLVTKGCQNSHSKIQNLRQEVQRPSSDQVQTTDLINCDPGTKSYCKKESPP